MDGSGLWGVFWYLQVVEELTVGMEVLKESTGMRRADLQEVSPHLWGAPEGQQACAALT